MATPNFPAGVVGLNNGESVSVNVGDMLIFPGPNASISGVTNTEIVNMDGCDGGRMHIILIEEAGTATIDLGICDLIQTGLDKSVAIKDYQTYLTPQCGGSTYGPVGLDRADIFMSWDEDGHGDKFWGWLDYDQDSIQLINTSRNNLDYQIRQAKQPGNFRRTRGGWIEGIAIELDLKRVALPQSLTATPQSDLTNKVEWKLLEPTFKYTIEQSSLTEKKVDLVTYNTSASDFYNYHNASANTPLSIQKKDISNVFLLEGTDGISLAFIHDKIEDGSGGWIDFAIQSPNATNWDVKDDPGDNLTLPKPRWSWAACCTDGGILQGGLNEEFTITIDPTFHKGISSWQFLSQDNRIDLNMDEKLTIKAEKGYEKATETDINPDQFMLERKFQNQAYSQITTLSGDKREYIDTDVTSSIEYTYRIYSQIGITNSEYSNEDTATPAENEINVI